MAEVAGQAALEAVWNEAYWADVEAASDGILGEIATAVAKASNAAAPTHYPTNSYQYLDHEARNGQLDGSGLRFRLSSHEAGIGIDDLVPERRDVTQTAYGLGVTTLAAHFSPNID